MARLLCGLLAVAVITALIVGWTFSGNSGPQDTDNRAKDVPLSISAPPPLAGADLARQQILGMLAQGTTQGYPASVPWGACFYIGNNGLYPLDFILHYSPTVFLEMCLERYQRDVQAYSVIFIKRECSDGKPGNLHAPEKIEVHFRERPFSVYMNWLEGTRLARKALYVEGENNNKLLGRGTGVLALLGIMTKDVDSPEAKSSGRYLINEFGMFKGTERTLDSMRKAQERGALHVTYQGLFIVPEAGDRPCYRFLRTPYDPPEAEGIYEATIYIDQESWLQVGTVLRDAKGELIGQYFFRDIRMNPEIEAKQFTRAAL